MPNTSTCESKCFHLDYQTNAPSSLRVILCSQNFKENECTLKTTFLSTKKKKHDSDKVCYLLYASSWYKLLGNVLANDRQKSYFRA